MILSLSEFCVWSTNESAVGDNIAGVFHQLTGRAFALDASAEALLRHVADGQIALDDVENPTAHTFLSHLIREGIVLSESPDKVGSCGIPERLASFKLHNPLRNPAIVVTHPDGRGCIYRTSDLRQCRIPRTRWRPDVICEDLPPVGVKILALAADSVAWRDAEAQLLAEAYSAEEIAGALRFLTDPERQLLRWTEPGTDTTDPWGFFQFPCQSFVWVGGESQGTPAAEHYEGIIEAAENFDWLETTVSHAFRTPTAALGGERFGTRVARHYLPWLNNCARDKRSLRILEVGGGLGYFASAFMDTLQDLEGPQTPITYTILDRSPALLKYQAYLHRHDGRFQFEMGDAQRVLPEGLYDLIIANEIIADFQVSIGEGQQQQNGALDFIALVATHLADGGRAYISEYGDLTSLPRRVSHLEHAEFSVQFEPLMVKARELGLEAVLINMAVLLKPLPSELLLIGQQERYLCIAKMLGERGLKLHSHVYDQEGFQAAFGLGLRDLQILTPLFAPQSSEMHFGPCISQFWVLELKAR